MSAKSVNSGKEVLLKDIVNDTFFMNSTLHLFMIKGKNGQLLVKDIQNNTFYNSSIHADDDKCTILTEEYTQFAYETEVERMKLIQSKKTPDKDFYNKHKITATPVLGSCWFTSTATVYKVLDKVHYIFDSQDSFGKDSDQILLNLIQCYKVITSNYHNQIKEVVQYLKGIEEIGEVWVLVSSHTVYHQIFIGNSTGYLCSMWFGDKHPAKTVKCCVEWKKNNKYFKEFKSEMNIKIKKSTGAD